MEGDRHGQDRAKPSASEEASSGDDDGGSTRPHPYYGCTFCKRGFSNAQALGGHMNIHRKDRAKALPPPPPVPSPEPGADQGYGCYGGGHAAYSPLSSAVRHLLGEDLRLGPSSVGGQYLGLPGGAAEAGVGERRRQEAEEDGEVDLELRLGHQPHDHKRRAV